MSANATTPTRTALESRVVRAAIALLLVFGSVSISARTVQASIVGRSDGNDTSGPLDLAHVRVSHASRTADSIQIRTISPFTNGEVDGKAGNFVGLFSIDGGRHLFRTLYVFYASGRMRGLLVNNFGSVESTLRAARVNARTVRVLVPHADMADKSYRIVLGSVWRGAPCSRKSPCVDWVPSHGSLLHDLVTPTAKWLHIPNPTSTEFQPSTGTTMTTHVQFSASDDRYGSGLRRWILQWHMRGASVWQTAAKGTKKFPTVAITGEQGHTYVMRLTVVDRQGNRATAEKMPWVDLPMDDRSANFTYDGTWSQNTSPDRLLGTATAGANGAHLSVTGRAMSVCVLLEPTTGPAATATALLTDVDTSSTSGFNVPESGSTPHTAISCEGDQNARHTWRLDITVTSDEPWIIDGVVFVG